MMELTINIPGLKELADALVLLAGVNAKPQGAQAAPEPVTPTPPAPQPAPYQQQMPVQQPMPAQAQMPVQQPMAYQQPMQVQQMAAVPVQAPVTPAAPVAPVAPMAPAVPTTAATQVYTQDQIAVAMTGLMDQGKAPAVMGILSRMGAHALTEIPKERYPELVMLLKEAGAVI